MGTINDYRVLRRGNEVKNIFTYSSGVATVNHVIVHDLATMLTNLISEGWYFV